MSLLQAALVLGPCGDHLVQPGNLVVEVLDDGDKWPQQRRQRLVIKRLR